MTKKNAKKAGHLNNVMRILFSCLIFFFHLNMNLYKITEMYSNMVKQLKIVKVLYLYFKQNHFALISNLLQIKFFSVCKCFKKKILKFNMI